MSNENPQAVGAPLERVVRPAEYRVPLRELVAAMVEGRRMEERVNRPPCIRCGAETLEQAQDMCQPTDCDCPGCKLWPDA